MTSKRQVVCHGVSLVAFVLAGWGCSAPPESLAGEPPDSEPPGGGVDPAGSDAARPGELSPAVLAIQPPPTAQPPCPLKASYVRPDGEPVLTERLIVQPELIATGSFHALALGGGRLFTIAGLLGAVVAPPAVVEIVSFDLDSLERQVLFTTHDGLQNPTALLVHQDTLYIHDWASGGTVFQVALAAPALDTLATDLGQGRDLSRWDASLYLSAYRGNRVLRLRDRGAGADDLASERAPLDPAKVVVEQLASVKSPLAMIAWQDHAAWGTHGDDGSGRAPNQLVIRHMAQGTDLAIDTTGSVQSTAGGAHELVWTAYGRPASELGRMPLDQGGVPQRDAIERVLFCSQPTSVALSGTLAVCGGPGLLFWERGSRVLQVLDTSFVLDVALTTEHIYYATRDGLYRFPRPSPW